MRLWMSLGLAAFFLGGCDASYTDLRPQEGLPDLGMDADFEDAGMEDSRSAPDSEPGVDSGPAQDAGVDASAGGEITGAFEGRGGYDASGTATLRETSEGLELVLSDDFAVDPGPGLEVVLSSVDGIGPADGPDSKLPEGAFVVGLLPSVSGGARLLVPAAQLDSLPDMQFVFIWCQPFDLEFGRAELGAP